MRALVTGAGGFVGQWLCRALLREGWEITGVSIEGEPTRGILSAVERRSVRWVARDLATPATPTAAGSRTISRSVELKPVPDNPGDATDGHQWLHSVMGAWPPDAVFHLAGVAFQAQAEADVLRAYDVNVNVAVSLLAAAGTARTVGLADPTVLVIGSAEQYGAHSAGEMPLPETARCEPKTVYGSTKVAQEQIVFELSKAQGVRVVATRSFNHSGPGQAPQFLLPSLVTRAKAAAATGGDVTIGNTDVIRDFLHVEDVVTAYISLVSRGIPGEVYNVCSGHGVRVGELAQEVLAAAGVRSPLKVDPALQRAVDVPVLVGDNTKLRAATGWTPVKSRSDIIQDLLDAAS